MKRFFRHFAFAAFGVSILCLALGIAMLIWTATAMKWISYGFGAVMILSGILQIASYLTGERVGLLRKLLLISGIIAAVAANAAIILLGGYDSAYTWIVVVLYFTTCHSTLIFCGAIGLSRALAGKPFRFPLIGPR